MCECVCVCECMCECVYVCACVCLCIFMCTLSHPLRCESMADSKMLPSVCPSEMLPISVKPTMVICQLQ